MDCCLRHLRKTLYPHPLARIRRQRPPQTNETRCLDRSYQYVTLARDRSTERGLVPQVPQLKVFAYWPCEGLIK